MKLQQILVISMSVIVLIIFVGLLFIFQSVSSVRNTANEQTKQILSQSTAIDQLIEEVNTVSPAVQTMNDTAELEAQLSSVQYAYADAGLTLLATKLDAANEAYDALMPVIDSIVKMTPELSEQYQEFTEAVEYARIYGNKIFSSFENNSPQIGASMANGLRDQMAVISGMLSVISESSVAAVSDSVTRVIVESDSVKSSATAVKTGGAVIIDEANSVSGAVFLVGLIVLALTAAVAFMLVRLLKSATDQVVSTVGEISRTKSLGLRINRKQKDELGDIARDVDGMVESFSNVVEQVHETAELVGVEIVAMSERSDGLNGLIQNQQYSVDNISAAITQMSASSSEVSSNATSTAETATQANETGQKSTNIVNASIKNIENLSSQLNSSQATINQLVSDVASIGGILEVIESIAEQTNLLALNAAIEAARAGEQGRGFAVVADEVRSLAGRTQTSTVEIRQTIENLQKRTELVVAAMDNSIKTSSESVAQAQEANEAISEISTALSEIMNLTQLIATSAREQSEAANEISGQVVALSDSSMEIADLSHENQAGGQRMANQGEDLNKAVSIFSI
jgi:methyl-accepting chemotaxis protein